MAKKRLYESSESANEQVFEELSVQTFTDAVALDAKVPDKEMLFLEEALKRFLRRVAELFSTSDAESSGNRKAARRIFDIYQRDPGNWVAEFAALHPQFSSDGNRRSVYFMEESLQQLGAWWMQNCPEAPEISVNSLQHFSPVPSLEELRQRCFLNEAFRVGANVPNRVDRGMLEELGEDLVNAVSAMLDQAKERKWNDNQKQSALFDVLGPELCIKFAETILKGGIPRKGEQRVKSDAELKTGLPSYAERSDHGTYVEVKIPIDPNLKKLTGAQRIPVSSLDEVGRQVFGHVESLNPIQSIVFDTAYNTNENMLICAPTGAGKTNIALLALTRALRFSGIGKQGVGNMFKAVYVAPMKALASEMCDAFQKRLGPLGLRVKEWTGDMQLTVHEVETTNVFVTTPEKWDVVTRKADASSPIIQNIRVMILDEVHLLHEERGPVIEAIVARTLRESERQQRVIRLVALSATLPNYRDVAEFLRVHPERGMFFFGAEFRPCPLSSSFYGVRQAANTAVTQRIMSQIAFDKCLEAIMSGKQVLVFVHSRRETVKTAETLRDLARKTGKVSMFLSKTPEDRNLYRLKAADAGNLLQDGFCVHHAGLLRSDRNVIEKAFLNGHCRVLVSTATLAWGVNLPAHAVVIKGTEVYDAERGGFVQLSMLDVLQMFGRAGRPQFDTFGSATLITSVDHLSQYVSMYGSNSMPIESKLHDKLEDHLNAEIVRGTVSSVREALGWLGYTFLAVRLRSNPMVYGSIGLYDMVHAAAKKLDECKMVRFSAEIGSLHSTDIGRVGAMYYITHETMRQFQEAVDSTLELSESSIIRLVSEAAEFKQLQSLKREDEAHELAELRGKYGEISDLDNKVAILLQCLFARARVKTFSLSSDMMYISQNAARIFRALFDMAVRRRRSTTAIRFLEYAICVDRQMWPWDHPLKQLLQLSEKSFVPDMVIDKLQDHSMDIQTIREMTAGDVGAMLNERRHGDAIWRAARRFPLLSISDVRVQPITRSILRVQVTLVPDWDRGRAVSGASRKNRGNVNLEPFWLWVEDPYQDVGSMIHVEPITFKDDMDSLDVRFTIPARDPLPSQYTLRIVSERWLKSEIVAPLNLNHVVLPSAETTMTDLLPVLPISISALHHDTFEKIYDVHRRSMHFFNPVQCQVFHNLYHTDENVLIGAPTGSGKTVMGELAIFKVLARRQKEICVYIAPLKALVKERLSEWKKMFAGVARVEELSGDVTPDARTLEVTDIIVTTPEKWDGISRNWTKRPYVRSVSLIIFDEIHMLGGDRGAILEVIVSRMRFMSWTLKKSVRFVGLSTALANPNDLATWLDIHPHRGLYNFRPTVRPVPVTVHIHSVPGRHYCPRMNAMNKPVFSAIREYSHGKPVLVFVSSRRQTRLTAQALISFAAYDEAPRLFVKEGAPADEVDAICATSIRDEALRDCLPFGVGLHHAGLSEQDRQIVERLFSECKITVLVSTSTLAWGVNLPAHMVVVKGTEFYDASTHSYVDMPITDVLQMIGRAGRPQFDTSAVAAVFCETSKKDFYQRFLYQPFPVESSLLSGSRIFEMSHSDYSPSQQKRQTLAEHLNAEIAADVLKTRQACIDYLSWTYLWRRLPQNPSFYGVQLHPDTGVPLTESFAEAIVEESLAFLLQHGCVEEYLEERKVMNDGPAQVSHPRLSPSATRRIRSTYLGRIASNYYTSPRTVFLFHSSFSNPTNEVLMDDLLLALSSSEEYAELPVRHNEDVENEKWAAEMKLQGREQVSDWLSPHVKTRLLLIAHMKRLDLPVPDYASDTKSVLDQAIRLLQSAVDIALGLDKVSGVLLVVKLTQMLMQGLHADSDARLQLSDSSPFHKSHRKLTFHELVYKFGDRERELAHFPRFNLSTSVGEGLKLKVRLERLSSLLPFAKLPRYPKQKQESFFVVVSQHNKIVGLRRAGLVAKVSEMEFQLPDCSNDVWTDPKEPIQIDVLSDSYYGLDLRTILSSRTPQ
eukprot:ANDGO_02041.mRNA.1 DExH-box ATP-dependent RNA helicase DExH14